MSKFCRFWLQLSLIYNAIIAVESLFGQAWMMLGIAAISLWCLTLLMQGPATSNNSVSASLASK